MNRRVSAAILATAMLGGCTTAPQRSPVSSVAENSDQRATTTTRPNDTLATLALPAPARVAIPADAATTLPADPPPSEALAHYARARLALVAGQRAEAIEHYRQSLDVYPESAIVHKELGIALRPRDAAAATQAFERAVELGPDRIEHRIELARQYLAAGDNAAAAWHLLEGRKASDYEIDEGAAAALDLMLGRALQNLGRAAPAAEAYASLIPQIDRPGFAVRTRPEVAGAVQQPELFYANLADLYEQSGQFEQAISTIERAAALRPEDLGIQARLARFEASAGQRDAALRRAVNVVQRSGATGESIDVLLDVAARLGDPGLAARALNDARTAQPGGDAILVRGLARVLRGQGSLDELIKVHRELRSADIVIVEHLVETARRAGRPVEGVRVIASALTDPRLPASQLIELYARLLDSRAVRRFELSALDGLDAPASSVHLLRAIGLQARSRFLSMGESLEAAMHADPALPAAFRYALAVADRHPQQTASDVRERVVQIARQRNLDALARELEARIAVEADQDDRARQLLEGLPADPELDLLRARVLRESRDVPAAERLLWRLVSDHPQFEASYVALFEIELQRQNGAGALNVLRRWFEALPQSLAGRVRQVSLLMQARQTQMAETVVLALIREYPDHPELLGASVAMLLQAERETVAVAALERLITDDNRNLAAIAELTRLHAARGRAEQAERVLQEARRSLSDAPDALYVIASLYSSIERGAVAHEVLREVLRLDPGHASAANDLGYQMADEGRELAEAKRLTRIAVDAEPDNAAFLDSLGWVLYKRGEFVEAERLIRRSVEADPSPDAVLLDHLGDVLWRLDRRDEAIVQWRAALREFEAGRGSEPAMRLRVEQKLSAAEQGGRVETAPVVGQ